MLHASIPRSIRPGVVLWAALAAHGLAAAPALAQSERAAPLLANERNLLVDTQARLLGVKLRPYRDLDKDLLDTTYDHPAEDLLLDVNAMFEENLQHELERSPEIQRAAAAIGEYVTKHIGIASLAAPGEPGRYRATRIAWICAPGRLDCASGYLPSLTEDGVRGYGDEAWKQAIARHCAAWRETDTKKDCSGYAKLLKMLYTQFPYFGGSTEYKDGKLDLEYWLYHLSTITKDPGRAQPPGSNSPKPILDYVTPRDSYLPVNNPRNLGLGITDGPEDGMSWDYIPWSLRRRIYYGIQRAFKDRVLGTDGAAPPNWDTVNAYWDNLDNSARKRIYGDVLRIPWSYAHMAAADDPSEATANVAGVRGNVLLKPELARRLYVLDYKKVAPTEDMMINLGGPPRRSLKEEADEFVQRHTDWYNKSRDGYLPIIGGMSGHTLGYLNLYIAALNNGGADTWAELPSLERCRAVLLAGLIGDKRHHSYAEVMSASHGFTHDWKGKADRNSERLEHTARTKYQDLWASKDKLIRDIAEAARQRTNDELVSPPAESVLAMLDLVARAKEKTTKDLRVALLAYLQASTTASDSKAAVDAVKKAVDELLAK